jgi:hypothetical protein
LWSRPAEASEEKVRRECDTGAFPFDLRDVDDQQKMSSGWENDAYELFLSPDRAYLVKL